MNSARDPLVCLFFCVNSDRLKSQKQRRKKKKKKKKKNKQTNKQTNVDANATKIIRIQTAPNFNIHRERGESLKKTDNDVYPKIESVLDKNLRGCVSFFNFS